LTIPGKNLRRGRIFRNDGKSLIVAMDHGMADGPIEGLEKPGQTLSKILSGGADAVLTTFGIAMQFHDLMKGRVGLIVRLDCGETSFWREPESKEQWYKPYSVRDALRIGADGVVVMGYLGIPSEGETLRNLAASSRECFEWGVPLLAEMITFKNSTICADVNSVAIGSRIGAEYGADFIKTYYSGEPAGFRRVTETCPVPVLIAGGEKMKASRDVLEVTKALMKAGAGGIAYGRNVWQHEKPEAMVRALAKIIHDDSSVEEALKLL